MGIFSGLFKSRDKPTNSYGSPSYSYFFGRANSGKRVTDRTALQHIAVYACVKVLSEAIVQHNLIYIYSRYDEANPKRLRESWQRSYVKIISSAKNAERGVK